MRILANNFQPGIAPASGAADDASVVGIRRFRTSRSFAISPLSKEISEKVGHQTILIAGFTRLDLLIAVGVILAIGILAWASIALAGEKRRVWVCAHHLKVLGQAHASYAHDHSDALPPAVFDDGQTSTSWDSAIAPYVEPGLKNQSSPEKRKELETKAAAYFKCPSDKEPRGGAVPRSYSMPMYDLNKVEWPPDKSCQGGLGLYLDSVRLAKVRKSLSLSLAEAEGQGEGTNSRAADFVPTIKLSMVSAPADTALLVERISIQNALWATKFACIVSAKEQFDAKTFEAKDFHGGKMNYLFLDGHVELLSYTQSAGFVGNGGVWTISTGD